MHISKDINILVEDIDYSLLIKCIITKKNIFGIDLKITSRKTIFIFRKKAFHLKKTKNKKKECGFLIEYIMDTCVSPSLYFLSIYLSISIYHLFSVDNSGWFNLQYSLLEALYNDYKISKIFKRILFWLPLEVWLIPIIDCWQFSN